MCIYTYIHILYIYIYIIYIIYTYIYIYGDEEGSEPRKTGFTGNHLKVGFIGFYMAMKRDWIQETCSNMEISIVGNTLTLFYTAVEMAHLIWWWTIWFILSRVVIVPTMSYKQKVDYIFPQLLRYGDFLNKEFNMVWCQNDIDLDGI